MKALKPEYLFARCGGAVQDAVVLDLRKQNIGGWLFLPPALAGDTGGICVTSPATRRCVPGVGPPFPVKAPSTAACYASTLLLSHLSSQCHMCSPNVALLQSNDAGREGRGGEVVRCHPGCVLSLRADPLTPLHLCHHRLAASVNYTASHAGYGPCDVGCAKCTQCSPHPHASSPAPRDVTVPRRARAALRCESCFGCCPHRLLLVRFMDRALLAPHAG
jgi:hypothetical protein